MGRKRTVEPKSVCKYCGCGVGNQTEICSNCYMKLKLIRQIKKMVRDIVRRECSV